MMNIKAATVWLAATLGVTGCVSTETHDKTLEELATTKKSSEAALEGAKKEAAVRIKALEDEKAKLAQDLSAEQTAGSRTRQALVTANENLDRALQAQRQLDEEAKQLRNESRQAQVLTGELRRERDLLRAKSDDLEQKVQTAKQEEAALAKALSEANQQTAALEKEKERSVTAAREVENHVRELQTKLQAEQSKVAALQQDKQNLLGGTTTAQEEIARLQRRAGELETEAVRVKDLEKRLSERDQQIGTLRQKATDRNVVAAKAALLAEDLEKSKQRAATLEQERAAKEAEIARLTRTHEDLTRSLKKEIEQGDIKIRQVRDRLTINMVDRVLFDSGQSQVKPAGLNVLKQVSDILKKVTDKQIRIEGHTDNVPIGAGLKKRFPTNWELSTARATSVVRFLIEDGGVDRSMISAGGYADTRPVESNDIDTGKAANRRIEIVLYPKDLTELAGEIKK